MGPGHLKATLKTTTLVCLLSSNDKSAVQTTHANNNRTNTSVCTSAPNISSTRRGHTRHVFVLKIAVFRKILRRQSCQKFTKTVLWKFPTFPDIVTKFHVFCHVSTRHVSKPQNFTTATIGPSEDTTRDIQGSIATFDIHTWHFPINRGVDLRQESHPQNGWHVSIQNLKPQASLNRTQSHNTFHITLGLQELSICQSNLLKLATDHFQTKCFNHNTRQKVTAGT